MKKGIVKHIRIVNIDKKDTLFVFQVPISEQYHVHEIYAHLKKIKLFSDKKYNNHLLIATVKLDVKSFIEKEIEEFGLKWAGRRYNDHKNKTDKKVAKNL